MLYYFNILLIAAVAILPSATKSKGLMGSRPNIIYINMDDLGIEELQVYNPAAPIPTPNLQRMAAQGLTFTRHYAGTSVCAPSRCALMTGKHTGHCEVRGNKQMEPHGQMPLSDAEVTVAELLRQAGYRTTLIGKWGLGTEGSSGEPNRQGFDSYYGYLDQVLAHNAFPEYLLRNGQREMLGNEVVWESPDSFFKGLGSYTPKDKQRVYANDLFTQEALQLLDNPGDKPFFLYLAYTIPHNNGEAPKADRFESPNLGSFAGEDWTETEKRYAASLQNMDRYIGQIIDKLETRGLSERTIVFFTSDNGSTEDIPTRFAAHNQLRGAKRSPYEGGLKSPLLVYWKNRIPAGSTSDELAAHWDFLPNACALAGVKAPWGIDGRLWQSLFQPGKRNIKPRPAYWEFHEQGGWQVYREGDYKLIFRHKTREYELYDVKSDPGEKKNIFSENLQIGARLKAGLTAARTESVHFRFGK